MFALSTAFMSGCGEKKEQGVAEIPAEIKEARPAAPVEPEVKTEEKKVEPDAPARPEEKAEEKKTPPAAAPVEEKAAGKPDAKSVQAGAAIYKSKCAPCHGPDGSGSVMAPALKGNEWVKAAADSDIANVIKNGRQGAARKYPDFTVGMPANKNIPEGDLNSLVDYVRSMN